MPRNLLSFFLLHYYQKPKHPNLILLQTRHFSPLLRLETRFSLQVVLVILLSSTHLAFHHKHIPCFDTLNPKSPSFSTWYKLFYILPSATIDYILKTVLFQNIFCLPASISTSAKNDDICFVFNSSQMMR